MRLYHGSKDNVEFLEKRQAGSKNKVPENELLNAVYLSPDYGFALACGSRPKGITNIDNENRIIDFENPELFKADREVFVYEIDVSDIKEDKLIKVDDYQYAVVGVDKIGILNKFKHKAIDIERYFKLKNWRKEDTELKNEFKMK